VSDIFQYVNMTLQNRLKNVWLYGIDIRLCSEGIEIVPCRCSTMKYYRIDVLLSGVDVWYRCVDVWYRCMHKSHKCVDVWY